MKQKISLAALRRIATTIRLLTLDISYQAHVGHVGSALSVVDILTVLYFAELDITNQTLQTSDHDRFILSKGHAAAALFATLYRRGILSRHKLMTFAKDGGLCEHPYFGDPGIEQTSGSLGHGLGVGVGMALGMRKSGAKHRTCVLVSDGETGEGSLWESAMLAGKMRLSNLLAVMDFNGWQCYAKTRDVTNITGLAARWRSCGWDVKQANGHNQKQLVAAFRSMRSAVRPQILIAHTTSGYGVPLIENTLQAHYHVFTKDEYSQSKKILEHL